jgi:HK97 family phage prohead protease
MNEMLHLNYGFEVRALADEKRSVDVIASSSAIDGYGEIVVQDWDLKRFTANPVVLFGHNSYDLPIGHASNVRVEDGKLLATLNLVDEKASPMAERVWQGIKQGSLRAVSVGFRTKNPPTTADVNGKAILMLSGNELIEISVVPIPANPEATALAARSLDLIRALVRKEPKNMKTINLALSLSADADESTTLTAVTALKAFEKDVLALTGKASAVEALGALTSLRDSSVAQAAKVLELEKAAELRERDELIRAGVAAKKLTPAQVLVLKEKPLDFVRGYIELAHPNPALAGNIDEPTHSTTKLEWHEKTFDKLSPIEKHELFHENHDLYVAMRDADNR